MSEGPQSPVGDSPPGAGQPPAPEAPAGGDPVSAVVPAEPEPRCPNCGASAEAGQLVCLQCGERLALDYKKAPSWRLPTMIVAGVLLLSGAGLAIALSRIGDDAKQTANSSVPTQQVGTGLPGRETAPPTSSVPLPTPKTTAAKTPTGKVPKPKAPAALPTGATPSPAPAPAPAPKPAPTQTEKTKTETVKKDKDGIASWPKKEKAWSVFLVSASSKNSARRRAKEAIEAGIEDVGVLRSDDYASLKPGFWVVFHGQYPTREKAQSRADADVEEGFDEALARFVEPK